MPIIVTSDLDFEISNYNYTTGALNNTISWGYHRPQSTCYGGPDVPLNISNNGPANYLITGYVNTEENFVCSSGIDLTDVIYGSLNPTVVTNNIDFKDETNSSFQLFPNPGNTELTVELKGFIENCEIRIYNLMGQKVISFQTSNASTKINTTDLNQGIYLIKLKQGSTELSAKWMKVE